MSNVDPTSVPPVVAVVVVHEPGPWFDDVLDGLAAQDYPNLRTLFLVTGGDPAERIMARLPGAFVRRVEGNPGFGPAANTVLDLVEGQNGFFCFLHDDVALDAAAIRLMVEELYRSNAGIVGPKLVEWDDPRRLQRVGLDVDRVGEVDVLVEPGELDQEQHDAVRDVFALPSACLLIRADLFRTLAFPDDFEYHGDDVDLCWRAHLLGARVMLVPGARARHRGQLVERRPDLHHRRLMNRHRVATVASLTGARRTPLVILWMVFITLAELVVGVFTGRARDAWSTLVATFGLVPRSGWVIARRREVRALRHVPDREVAELQLRGSARVTRFLRSRQSGAVRPGEERRRRLRRSPTAAFVTWVAVLAVAVLGSRQLITGGVAPLGDFLPLPSSPDDLFAAYRSGWWEHGLGSTGAAPTGFALLGLAGVAAFANMGLAHTLLSVGLLFVGYLGAWRLTSMLPGDRARIVGLVVYAAVPLPYASFAGGRWAGLAAYAAVPWVVHLLRVGSGLAGGVDLDRAADGEADPLAAHGGGSRRARLRAFASLVLVTALVVAFAPSFVVVAAVVGLTMAGTTLVVSGRLGVVATLVGMTVTAAILSLALHLPWSLRFFERSGDDAFFGADLAGPRGDGLVDLARFGVGGSALGVLALGLYLPVIVAPLIARGWRFAWSVRAAGLVLVPGLLLVAGDRGAIPEVVADPVLLMAPVALGLALAAACAAAAFVEDVRGATFGWRQPLGVLTALAVGLGVLPVLVAAAGGRWEQDGTPLAQLLTQLPADPDEGDYRVLHVGDPRVLPVPGWTYRDGMAYAITDDGPLTVSDSWVSTPSTGVRSVADVLDMIAGDRSTRGGRALAPLGIRFIVVPRLDGAASTLDDPLPTPEGLLDALGDQLDLRRRYASAELVIYENTAWIPVRAVLSGGSATASTAAGLDALTRSDLSGAEPVMIGGGPDEPATAAVDGGTMHLGVPRAAAWQLRSDGQLLTPRTSFGTVTAWDLEGPGELSLTFDTPASRGLAVTLQVLVWVLLAAVALYSGPLTWKGRRSRAGTASLAGGTEAAGPVLDLSGELDLRPLPGAAPEDLP